MPRLHRRTKPQALPCISATDYSPAWTCDRLVTWRELHQLLQGSPFTDPEMSFQELARRADCASGSLTPRHKIILFLWNKIPRLVPGPAPSLMVTKPNKRWSIAVKSCKHMNGCNDYNFCYFLSLKTKVGKQNKRAWCYNLGRQQYANPENIQW